MTDEREPGNDELLKEKGDWQQAGDPVAIEESDMRGEANRLRGEAPAENELGEEHLERPPLAEDNA